MARARLFCRDVVPFVGLVISREPRNRVEKDRGRGAARGGGGGEFFFVFSNRLSLFFGV